MKASKTAISILFLSAACATPAFANYFNNPVLNMRFNVGSAPNPTPRDIRENRMPQMTRVTRPVVEVAVRQIAPVGLRDLEVQLSPVRIADAADSIPALRLNYL